VKLVRVETRAHPVLVEGMEIEENLANRVHAEHRDWSARLVQLVHSDGKENEALLDRTDFADLMVFQAVQESEDSPGSREAPE